MMEDCFRDMYNIGAGYERAKGCCKAKFNNQETSMITEVKTMKEPGPCYKCVDPTLKTTAKTLRETTATNSKTRHQHGKTTRETTTHTNFVTIRTIVLCSPTGILSFQHPKKLGHVMICH